MDRRSFLRTSAYVSAGAVAGVRPAFAADADIEITPQDRGPEISPHLYGQFIEHLGGEEREILEAFRRVVEDFRVDEGEFGALNTVSLHLLEFAQDFGLDHGGAEPPPADHWTGFVGWIEKVFAEGVEGRRGLGDEGGHKDGCGAESGGQEEKAVARRPITHPSR